MPTYEFRCRTCDTVFEERRPMAEASDAASCPDGHHDTIRLISLFAAARGPVAVAGNGRGSGGCCGGGACGCR
ncbi:MAG: FmdB family zinc ribbon protein [Acidimicrobiales bacterium]